MRSNHQPSESVESGDGGGGIRPPGGRCVGTVCVEKKPIGLPNTAKNSTLGTVGAVVLPSCPETEKRCVGGASRPAFSVLFCFGQRIRNNSPHRPQEQRTSKKPLTYTDFGGDGMWGRYGKVGTVYRPQAERRRNLGTWLREIEAYQASFGAEGIVVVGRDHGAVIHRGDLVLWRWPLIREDSKDLRVLRPEA